MPFFLTLPPRFFPYLFSVIFLADDAGYADFGFNGSEDLQTPNIDKLASAGIILTNAHVLALVCAP